MGAHDEFVIIIKKGTISCRTKMLATAMYSH